MKNIKILLIPLVLLLANSTWAQVFSDNFDGANCEDNTCSCCAVNFIDDFMCLSQWSPSHGSPNTQQGGDPIWLEAAMGLNGLPISGKAVAMVHITNFGCVDDGEGMFTDQIRFEAGECYKISLRLSKRVNSGNFHIRASNGLSVPNNIDQCCGDVPNVESQPIVVVDLATINTGTYQSWATIEAFFSPEQNYNQLWLYPDYYDGVDDPEDDAVAVLIDDVEVIKDCPENLTFSNPFVGITPGFYKRSDYIIAGNAGGAGVIVNNPNAITFLEAGNYVKLTPNTHVTANGSNNFVMRCRPCANSEECRNDENFYTVSEEHIRIPDSFHDFDDEVDPLNDSTIDFLTNPSITDFEIIPNPNKGVFSLNIPGFSFGEREDKINIQIYDYLGKEVYRDILLSNDMTFDLSYLPKGVYFVNISTPDQTLSKRLLIQ